MHPSVTKDLDFQVVEDWFPVDAEARQRLHEPKPTREMDPPPEGPWANLSLAGLDCRKVVLKVAAMGLRY